MGMGREKGEKREWGMERAYDVKKKKEREKKIIRAANLATYYQRKKNKIPNATKHAINKKNVFCKKAQTEPIFFITEIFITIYYYTKLNDIIGVNIHLL